MSTRLAKSAQVLAQKKEYEVMLSRLHDRNEQKEKKITELHKRLKRVEKLKARLLQKEKQLFELGKRQASTTN